MLRPQRPFQVCVLTFKRVTYRPPQLIQWDNETLNSDDFSGYSFDGGVLSEWPESAYLAGRTNANEVRSDRGQ